MRKEAFPSGRNWYRGNLHSHSTNSDGRFSPEEAAAMYRKYGYDFMCLSEHDYFTDLRSTLDRKDFILLPGVEASVNLVNKERTHVKKTHHIHGILGNEAMQKAAGDRLIKHGERLVPPVYEEDWNGLDAAQAMVDELNSRGCFTTYNHPVWSRVDMDEAAGLKGVWGIEIYNYGTVVECGEGEDTTFWDAMLRKGTGIHGFASDDNHNPPQFFDSFGGYVMVCAETLTHEAIVNSLLAGEYYSSSGPVIHQWGLEDGEVFVECSPAYRINFIAGGPVGRSETLCAHENLLTGGRHKLRGDETYVRVECVDEKGRKAWTNALFL